MPCCTPQSLPRNRSDLGVIIEPGLGKQYYSTLGDRPYPLHGFERHSRYSNPFAAGSSSMDSKQPGPAPKSSLQSSSSSPTNLSSLTLPILLRIISFVPSDLQSIARFSLALQSRQLHILFQPHLKPLTHRDFRYFCHVYHPHYAAFPTCWRCNRHFPIHHIIGYSLHSRCYCIACFIHLMSIKSLPVYYDASTKCRPGSELSDDILKKDSVLMHHWSPEWMLHEAEWRQKENRLEVKIKFEDVVGTAWNLWRPGRAKWRSEHKLMELVSRFGEKYRPYNKRDVQKARERVGWVPLETLLKIMADWEGLMCPTGRPLKRIVKQDRPTGKKVEAAVEPVTVERLLKLWLDPEGEIRSIERGLRGSQTGWGNTEEKERILTWIEMRRRVGFATDIGNIMDDGAATAGEL
ncbi:hypothetical protein EX30DRAFT_86312 [Ascodesmis nigricans]|uniref:Uncharacterized protein n=1 Tax=Ascodesmis nigricans TaxID=341454 RepID=A0A4S2N3I1_9PEZI|nr:hypothetical protein EX30DRAFT_86312 [Ascodesmis nigricans]